MKLSKIEIGLSPATIGNNCTAAHVMICKLRNWTLRGLSVRADQQRFYQCYGSIGIFQIKLFNFTPCQHQNFWSVKPSAFGQVNEIIYLKEKYDNYS